jgi:uncharacterized membrane protein
MEIRSRTNEVKNILYLLRKLGIIKAIYDKPLQKHYFSIIYPTPDKLDEIVIATEAILSVMETQKKELFEEELERLVLEKNTVKKEAYETSLELLKKAGTISIYNCPSAADVKKVIKIVTPPVTTTSKPSNPDSKR